jgi:hypothetical protein
MTSTKGSINPERARLIKVAIDCATAALEKSETFLPGSIAVLSTGKYDLAIAGTGGTEGSNLLILALRQKASEGVIRAAAIYRDVRVRPEGETRDVDAIHIVAELASGEAAHVFQVYRRDDAGRVTLGQREIEPAPAVIFTASAKRWWQVWK